MATPRVKRVSSSGRTGSILPSEAEWARIRPAFERLYIDEHATLEATMQELRQTHNFRATKQMFKRRIREWGLGKNLKQHEVEHILGIAAQRKAQGKRTAFLLRGREVDMRSVRAYQRRQKLFTADAVAAYVTGGSRGCSDLRVLTPEPMDPSSWATHDQSYENTLRAFRALFGGLVDSRYYWIELGEIVMPPSLLRGQVSDVCSSLVASKAAGQLNMVTVRKLALLLESIICSRDAWIHCRLVYTLWIISTAGYAEVTEKLLTHLHKLAVENPDKASAQHRFVSCYSSLESSRAAKFAADIISLKADMVRSLRVDHNSVAFKLRSLDYDVYWRQREQGNAGDSARALRLFAQCQSVLGILAVETLTILRSILQDDNLMQTDAALDAPLQYLRDSDQLEFRINPCAFAFDGRLLSMEAASELACIYCQLGLHGAEAWIFSRLLVHQKETASGLRREYSLLVHISRCEVLSLTSQGQAWLRRKQKIDDIWRAEVEAAVTPVEIDGDKRKEFRMC